MAGNGYEKFFNDARKAKSGASGGMKFDIKPEAKSAKTAMGGKAHKRRGTPEEKLREELALRIQSKRRQSLRRRKKLPLTAIVTVAFALATSAFGYFKSDLLDEMLSKIEIGAFGKALASDEQAKKDEKKDEKKETASKEEKKEEKSAGVQPEKKENAAGAKVAEKTIDAEAVKQWTPEEISFFSKLSERKKELDLREAELTKLEEELQKRKVELDERLKRLETMREEISKTLKTRVATDQQKVDKLVEFYSSMKPQQAAKVIESLNEDLAVEVLDKMKKKNAAEILDMMNAKKARRLSELLTGYERTTASVDGDENAPSAGAEKETAPKN